MTQDSVNTNPSCANCAFNRKEFCTFRSPSTSGKVAKVYGPDARCNYWRDKVTGYELFWKEREKAEIHARQVQLAYLQTHNLKM